MVAPRQPPLLDLVDELLAEQGRLQTPVARFAAAFDAGTHVTAPAAQLIPLTRPGPGEQYAFEVDLDACSGCKSCVAACHSLNGLDEAESWRDVGLIHGGSPAAPFQQTVTTACHHCADPACLNGCPVLAYEKDPLTGIVRHLDDQCIGCQYCVLKCPYDVPKYNERLGIVRKCDLCHQRLGAGEAPACAQACPTHAIKIVKVLVSTDGADTSAFLTAAPDPAYTQPTTRYRSSRLLPANLHAADEGALRPQPAHWPLVFMLTLIPASVGLYGAAALTAFAGSAGESAVRSSATTAWLLGAAGLGASVFHLGQPLRAWRIFLGWRRSWLSREALVFGAWFGAASTTTLVTLGWFPVPLPAATMLAATVGLGLLGVCCSIMIYVDTRRVLWRLAQTAPRFLGTAVVLGCGVVAPVVSVLMLAAKIAVELSAARGSGATARLLRTLFRPVLAFRLGLALLGGGLLLGGAIWAGLAALLAGELAERTLYFRAVEAPKMPGVPSG